MPFATGKLSIWAAKMKAAAKPTTGTSRSSSDVLVFLRHHATPAIAISPATSDVGPSMNPSGMCIPIIRAPLVSAGPALDATDSQLTVNATSSQSKQTFLWSSLRSS